MCVSECVFWILDKHGSDRELLFLRSTSFLSLSITKHCSGKHTDAQTCRLTNKRYCYVPACMHKYVRTHTHTHKHSIWGKMSSKKHCHYSITSAIHYFLSLSSPELQFTFCCHQCYHGSHPQTNWRRLANKKRLIGETSKLRPFSLSFSLLLLPLSGVPIINRYLRTFHRVGVSLSASYKLYLTKLTNGADIVSTLAHTHTRTHAHNYKYPIL